MPSGSLALLCIFLVVLVKSDSDACAIFLDFVNHRTSEFVEMAEDDCCRVLDQESHPHVPKQRKLRSAVWNDMTKQPRGDGSYFAICNHCKKKMLGSSAMGTTHLKNHLRFCAAFKSAKSGQTAPVEASNGEDRAQDLGERLSLPKRRKLRSAVWNEMTKEHRGDGSYVAVCNHCKKRMVGNSASGTTHLKNHLRLCASFRNSGGGPADVGKFFSECGEKRKPEAGRLDCFGYDPDRGKQDFVTTSEDQSAGQYQEPRLRLPRRRKLRSAVWNDMTKEQREDGSYFAICNHCKKKMVGNSTRGTTHLKNHLRFCAAFKRSKCGQTDVGQLFLEAGEFRRAGGSSPDCFKFDPERSRQDFARMLILHDYPAAIVDHVGFRTFLRNLQPQFRLVPRDAVQADCMGIYRDEREKLQEALARARSRISLAGGLWVTAGGSEHLSLTCHFVDDDWKLQKKTLNFVELKSGRDSSEISKAIEEEVAGWQITGKLFGLVLDDSLGKEGLVQDLVYSRFGSELLLDPELFPMQCWARILDLIVQDGLKVEEVSGIIERIRGSVEHVGKTRSRRRRFQRCAQQFGGPGRPLLLDSPARWQTTFSMLETALEYRDAFSHLPGLDRSYGLPPSAADWDTVRAIVDCVSLFHEATSRFSCSKRPAINFCFVDLCSVYVKLKEWCNSPSPCIQAMAARMFEEFAGRLNGANLLLVIGSILDPRFKMKSVDYLFAQLYFDDFSQRIYDVHEAFLKLYKAYSAQYERAVMSQASETPADNGSPRGEQHHQPGSAPPSGKNTLDFMRKGLGRLLLETSLVQPRKSDVDLYLEEDVIVSDDDHFDVLRWWMQHAERYPVLAMMARDILAVPVSVAASKSASGAQNMAVDHHLSSLDPHAAQSLLCAQDWLRGEIEGSFIFSRFQHRLRPASLPRHLIIRH